MSVTIGLQYNIQVCAICLTRLILNQNKGVDAQTKGASIIYIHICLPIYVSVCISVNPKAAPHVHNLLHINDYTDGHVSM